MYLIALQLYYVFLVRQCQCAQRLHTTKCLFSLMLVNARAMCVSVISEVKTVAVSFVERWATYEKIFGVRYHLLPHEDCSFLRSIIPGLKSLLFTKHLLHLVKQNITHNYIVVGTGAQKVWP